MRRINSLKMLAIRLARLLHLNFVRTLLDEPYVLSALVRTQFKHTRRTILELP